MILMNKKGFVTVFVCIFFTSLIILLNAFITASKQKAVDSSVNSLQSLWIQSILAEYDLNVYNRYGLFGFYGYPEDIEEKMMFYVNDSFNEKKYIDVNKCVCRLYEYSLMNTRISKDQITAAGKNLTVQSVISDEQHPAGEIIRVENGNVMDAAADNVFDELPSEGNSAALSVDTIKNMVKNIKSLQSIIKTQTDRYYINKYIDFYFKNAVSDKHLGTTYFDNEIEYLIAGKHSDYNNKKYVRNTIIAIREVSNLRFLNTDMQRRNAMMSVAEVLTPEAPLVTFEALAASWAFAESINDYNLLMQGHKVAFNKTGQTWATDLDQVLKNIKNPCIYTGTDTGQDYSDYLSFLTYSMDENVLILRILDLIQINMRANYFDSFRIKHVNGGVSVLLEINGKKYEKYRKY